MAGRAVPRGSCSLWGGGGGGWGRKWIPESEGVCGATDASEGKGPQRRAPEAVRQAVGGGCRSGWGRLLSVTNAVEAGTCRQRDSGWAIGWTIWRGGMVPPPLSSASLDGPHGPFLRDGLGRALSPSGPLKWSHQHRSTTPGRVWGALGGGGGGGGRQPAGEGARDRHRSCLGTGGLRAARVLGHGPF